MPNLSTAKLIGAGVGLLAIISFVLLAFHWKSTMTERGERLTAICTATRTASGNPDLACKDVPKQISFMGETISALSNSLKVQNAAVASLGEQTKQQQAESAKASQAAQERSKKADATSTRLDASSRSSAATAKPCEPSKALTEAWK